MEPRLKWIFIQCRVDASQYERHRWVSEMELGQDIWPVTWPDPVTWPGDLTRSLSIVKQILFIAVSVTCQETQTV